MNLQQSPTNVKLLRLFAGLTHRQIAARMRVLPGNIIAAETGDQALPDYLWDEMKIQCGPEVVRRVDSIRH